MWVGEQSSGTSLGSNPLGSSVAWTEGLFTEGKCVSFMSKKARKQLRAGTFDSHFNVVNAFPMPFLFFVTFSVVAIFRSNQRRRYLVSTIAQYSERTTKRIGEESNEWRTNKKQKHDNQPTNLLSFLSSPKIFALGLFFFVIFSLFKSFKSEIVLDDFRRRGPFEDCLKWEMIEWWVTRLLQNGRTTRIIYLLRSFKRLTSLFCLRWWYWCLIGASCCSLDDVQTFFGHCGEFLDLRKNKIVRNPVVSRWKHTVLWYIGYSQQYDYTMYSTPCFELAPKQRSFEVQPRLIQFVTEHTGHHHYYTNI